MLSEPTEVQEKESQIQASMASRMLEWIEPILAGEESAIHERAFRIMNDGDALDPQLAVQLWSQLHGMHRTKKLLQRIVTKGEQASRRAPLTI